MQPFVDFLVTNMPPLKTILLFGPVGLLWASVCLIVAGMLKRRADWPTGYTRKTFHFLIFTSAVIVHAVWGTSTMCLFGGMTSLVILFAVLRGEGNLLFEAIAREKDAPRRAWFVVAPYFATLIGGVTSHVWFGSHAAVAGMLVTGLADAIAEPVGTRFGKHPYRVITLTEATCTRTIEGSTAVFIASILSLVIAVQLHPDLQLSWSVMGIVFGVAAISTLVEAVSPHGWDNLTLQLLPSWLVWSWL